MEDKDGEGLGDRDGTRWGPWRVDEGQPKGDERWREGVKNERWIINSLDYAIYHPWRYGTQVDGLVTRSSINSVHTRTLCETTQVALYLFPISKWWKGHTYTDVSIQTRFLSLYHATYSKVSQMICVVYDKEKDISLEKIFDFKCIYNEWKILPFCLFYFLERYLFFLFRNNILVLEYVLKLLFFD